MLQPGQAFRLATFWIKRGDDIMKINQSDWWRYKNEGWKVTGESRGNAPAEVEAFYASQSEVEDVRKANPKSHAHGDQQRAFEGRSGTVSADTAKVLLSGSGETDGSTGGSLDAPGTGGAPAAPAAAPSPAPAPAPAPAPTPAPASTPAPAMKVPAGTVFVDAQTKAPEGGGTIPRGGAAKPQVKTKPGVAKPKAADKKPKPEGNDGQAQHQQPGQEGGQSGQGSGEAGGAGSAQN